jgi:hypothetical protein
MISLQEFRQKYPQYDDMNDQQLVDSLHNKFYQDIPKDQFYQKIGFTSSQPIASQAKPPSRVAQLFSMIGQYGKQLGQTSLDQLKGAADALVNLPAEVANVALPQKYQIPTFKSSEGTDYNIGHLIGEMAAYPAGGEVLGMGREAAEAIPLVGKLAESLGAEGLKPTIARQGLGGALYGASQQPENKTQGAVVGGALGGLGGGLESAVNMLRPSRLFRGTLSDEELMRNMNVSRGTQTGLGDVIESPTIKQFHENYIAKVPFSGVDQSMGQTKKLLEDQGNNILAKYLGTETPENVPQKINDYLAKAKEIQTLEKNRLYGDANKIAEESSLNLELPNFTDTANKHINLINDQSFLKYEPEARALLSRLSNYKEIPGKGDAYSALTGMGATQSPSLSEANMLAGKLNDLASKYRSSPAAEDRHMSGVLSELGRSLKTDIKTGINSSGNDQLISAFSAAEKNYKENFSPFLDKDIWSFANRTKDSDDLITRFIKTGKNTDKGNQLENLMSKLPPEGQDLVKYEYLSRALKGSGVDRRIDPNALKTLWTDKNLGPRQKAALMPNLDEREQMDRYAKLVGMNPEALSAMVNPKTGVRNVQGLLGLTAAISAGMGHYAFPAMATGAVLGSRQINKMLTNPVTREKLIQAMIENKNKSSLIPSGITQAIAAQYQRGNQ